MIIFFFFPPAFLSDRAPGPAHLDHDALVSHGDATVAVRTRGEAVGGRRAEEPPQQAPGAGERRHRHHAEETRHQRALQPHAC